MKLFYRFDKTYCINLDRRPDRLKNFQGEVDKYNLGNYERISAVDGINLNLKNYNTNLKPGELGLILTNISIIESAIKNKYDSILIIEDDCYFTDEINNIESYFTLLPNDWDMLYMGGNHNTHMSLPPPKIINDKVSKLHSTYSTHFVAIKNSIFVDLLILLKQFTEPLDMSYVKIQKIKNVYSFYPAIAKQKVDFSDIVGNITDYNWLIK